MSENKHGMAVALSDSMLDRVSGGGWLGDAWDTVADLASDAADAIVDAASAVVDAVKEDPDARTGLMIS